MSQSKFSPLVYILLVAISNLPAQESRGTISGRVTDSSGAALPDASVLVVSTQTQTEFHANTNESGLFTIPFLVPGLYTVVIEHPGFKKLVRNGIQLQVNDTVALDLAMALGDVSQNVEVSGAPPLLRVADSSLGQVVDTHQMVELPNPSGNPAEFVTLTPGVTNLSIAIHKAAFNAGTSSFMVNGNTSQSNEFGIDGVPNTFASGTAPRIAFSAPQSAISEFKVMTTFYDAAMGHTPGAIINVTTTTGASQLHGELHGYFGASALNRTTSSVTSEASRRPSGATTPMAEPSAVPFTSRSYTTAETKPFSPMYTKVTSGASPTRSR
ncbi:MAG TPA: carboxypeptidase-like regulatory domain-containing protein [Bryobacteraceae bacterium]|nr:carboxypeptidase-like regulatory domain-containing protein [Bryobacteraceae bacterium]